ncbi:MAG: hypothetical protein PWQ96_89 [Clostridia bacterium]|nr:NAD(P)/FAD-dependent oxidoreductase [Clostridiales bacterium]MDK2984447.1 hypothetical protein [Clostridia bacterium]
MGEVKKKDIPELGSIVQRDRETYAIVPHLPAGVTDVNGLKKIAEVAEKYGAQAIKVTSAQRIAIVGIKEEDLEAAWEELGMEKGQAIGKVVRSVKVCPGTTFCRVGLQDAVGMGMELDKLYHGMELPWKFKIGVSGCPNSCSESWVKDIGLIGSKNGYKIVVGGNSGKKARVADELFAEKSVDETKQIVKDLLEVYKETANKAERFSAFIERVGLDNLKYYLEEEDEAKKEKIKESFRP